MEQRFDLAVIGGGPAGYVAAIRGAQLGLRTACIERDPYLGGTCLNVGCIPSKALLDSSERFHEIRHKAAEHGIRVGEVTLDLATMMARKEQVVAGLRKGVEALFRKNGVTWIHGSARLEEPDCIEVTPTEGERNRVVAPRVLIATGSAPIPFPGAPFDEERILSSTGALQLSEVPEHLIVIGGGVIGLELGSVWLRLGARVTVLERAATILPTMDGELVRAATAVFTEQGFHLKADVEVRSIERQNASGVRVMLEGGEVIEGDHCLVAIGRAANTEGLGAREVGVSVADSGFIKVDGRYHTGVGGIYAVGDVIGGDLLAHKAMEEGIAAVENATGRHGSVNYGAIASVVYTCPEIAAVGLTEERARREIGEVVVGKFPFAASGRARAFGESEGLVKVVADAESGRLVGLHILGPRASDLIAEAGLAVEFEGEALDIALTPHAHPSFSEALKEAALASLGRAIHL